MGLRKMLDPDENMDLCCFGAMRAKKGVFVIGILEIIGVILVLLKTVRTYMKTDDASNMLIAASVIAAANIVSIIFMLYGVKKEKAFTISGHLIVHVVNIISLVFALLMSSMSLVQVNTESSLTTVTTTTMASEEVDSWANIKWALQITITAICLILETWFFNVEYTIFLQLCDKNKSRKLSFTRVEAPKAVYG